MIEQKKLNKMEKREMAIFLDGFMLCYTDRDFLWLPFC